MENGRSYGCCAAIGGAGTALFGLVAIAKGGNGYYVNLYNDGTYSEKESGTKISVRANLYKKGEAKISVKISGETTLFLRIRNGRKNSRCRQAVKKQRLPKKRAMPSLRLKTATK